MGVERSGTVIDSSVLFALGSDAPQFAPGLGDNPTRHERRRGRQPWCNKWHTGNASTASNENLLISSDGFPRKVRENQCPNRGNPKNTDRRRTLAPRKRKTRPRDPVWRCQKSEFSRNAVGDLLFGCLPIRKSDFPRLSKAGSFFKNAVMPNRRGITLSRIREVRPNLLHGTDFLGDRHLF